MRRSIAPSALLVLLACTRADPESDVMTVDERGARVVTVAALGSEVVPRWETELVFSTAGHDSLGIGDAVTVTATFLPDTSLWIGFGSTILILDRDGHQIGTAGRQGSGPGEFTMLTAIGPSGGGGIHAGEAHTRRVARFDPQGRHLGTLSGLQLIDPRGELEILTVLDGGEVVGIPWQARPALDMARSIAAQPFPRDRLTLVRYDSTGAIRDTLGEWPGLQRFGGMSVRFARAGVHDGRGNRMAIGISDSIDVTLFDGPRPVTRLLGPPTTRAVTAADIAAWEAGVRHELDQFGETVLKRLAETEHPELLPTVGGLVLDADDNLWLGGYATPADASREWQKISPQGDALGKISLPVYTTALFPARTELLDAAGDRLAVLRELPSGEVAVEVRTLKRVD